MPRPSSEALPSATATGEDTHSKPNASRAQNRLVMANAGRLSVHDRAAMFAKDTPPTAGGAKPRRLTLAQRKAEESATEEEANTLVSRPAPPPRAVAPTRGAHDDLVAEEAGDPQPAAEGATPPVRARRVTLVPGAARAPDVPSPAPTVTPQRRATVVPGSLSMRKAVDAAASAMETPTKTPVIPSRGFRSVQEVIKHIEDIGKQRMETLNTSASAVQSAGKRGVFRIKLSSRTLAETYADALSDLKVALATELDQVYERAVKTTERIPEGHLGKTTFLHEATGKVKELHESEQQQALKERGKRAVARRKARPKADDPGESVPTWTLEEKLLPFEELEQVLELATIRRDARFAEVENARNVIAQSYLSSREGSREVASHMARCVVEAISALPGAQATELGALLEQVRSALLHLRVPFTSGRRLFLQEVGEALLKGSTFAEAMGRVNTEWAGWRDSRQQARRKAAEAQQAQRDAEGDPVPPITTTTTTTPAPPPATRVGASTLRDRTKAGKEHHVDAVPEHDNPGGLRDDEEEAVLLGTCGTGPSIASNDPEATTMPASAAAEPAFLRALKSRKQRHGRRAVWIASELEADVALLSLDVVQSLLAADGGGLLAKLASSEPGAETLRRTHWSKLERLAAEQAGLPNRFPSLFAVAAFARAIARSRAAQLSASQSNVRALFSRFRGRMSAQAGVLGEEAAKATLSITQVQDSELPDTLDVVRTTVTLLKGFKLSNLTFVERVNATLGLGTASSADGFESVAPVEVPEDIITIAEKRAEDRMGFLIRSQQVMCRAWRGYCTRVERRVRLCAEGVVRLSLTGIPNASLGELDPIIDTATRLLLAMPRSHVAMRGVPSHPYEGPRKGWTGPIPADVLNAIETDKQTLPPGAVCVWAQGVGASPEAEQEAADAARLLWLKRRREWQHRFDPKAGDSAIADEVDVFTPERTVFLVHQQCALSVNESQMLAASTAEAAATDFASRVATNRLWAEMGVSPASLLELLRACKEIRVGELSDRAHFIQRWFRRRRGELDTGARAMADLVADTILDFQRALDRELNILTSRARSAVARVQRKDTEGAFLEALNSRMAELARERAAEA
jgi:hypothetical protein